MLVGDRSQVVVEARSVLRAFQASLVITRIVCIGTYSILCASAAETRFSITADSKAMLYIPLQRNTMQKLNCACALQSYSGMQPVSYSSSSHLFFVQRKASISYSSSSYSVSTDYYTRPIKSKWPGLVANLRPLRTTSAANNNNKYQIKFQSTHKNSYPHHSHIKQNMCQCTQFVTFRDSRKCSKD